MSSPSAIAELILSAPVDADYFPNAQREYSRTGANREWLAPVLGQAKEPVREGAARALLGEREAAIALLQKDPANDVALSIAARILLDHGKYTRALEVARKAAEAGGSSGARLVLAEALGLAGETDAARKQMQGLKLDESSGLAHYLSGAIAQGAGEYREALEHTRAAAVAAPGEARYQFRLGYLESLYGDEDAAIRAYEAAARCEPRFVHALLNLGVLYEDVDRNDDASDCYHAVLDVYPDHPRALLYVEDSEASSDMYYDREKEKERSRRNQLLQLPVTDFELSVRSRNCLAKMNIHTLGDLIQKSEAELLSYKNFGETSLSEIKRILNQKGLRLGAGPEEGRREVKSLSDGEQGRMLTDPVSVLELSSRSQRCMDRLGIETLGDLVKKSELDLISQKNFGVTSLNEVKKKLAEKGLGLAGA